MKFTPHHLKYLNLLFLPIIIWLFTNAAINTHTHIINNGIIISHAHPYDKSGSNPDQFPGHNHTKSELFLLDLFSHPLILLTFATVIFILSNRNKLIFIPYLVQSFFREHYYVLNYHAPPSAFL